MATTGHLPSMMTTAALHGKWTAIRNPAVSVLPKCVNVVIASVLSASKKHSLRLPNERDVSPEKRGFA